MAREIADESEQLMQKQLKVNWEEDEEQSREKRTNYLGLVEGASRRPSDYP